MDLQTSTFSIYKYSLLHVVVSIFFSTVLRCRTLFPPLNGFLVGDCDNSFGCTCQMKCKDGYNLLGSEILTCLHKPGHLTGYWNGSIPNCKSKRQIVVNDMSPSTLNFKVYMTDFFLYLLDKISPRY